MENSNLQQLKQKYSQSRRQKIEKIGHLIKELKSSPSRATLEAFRMEVHKIAGSAGMYGYEETGRLCGEMDGLCLKKIKQAEINGEWLLDENKLNIFFQQLNRAFFEGG